jgi:hypothetical protein
MVYDGIKPVPNWRKRKQQALIHLVLCLKIEKK